LTLGARAVLTEYVVVGVGVAVAVAVAVVCVVCVQMKISDDADNDNGSWNPIQGHFLRVGHMFLSLDICL
jgi:hypothetical protein